MGFFALKISDPDSTDLVNEIKAGSIDFTVDRLNQLESDLIEGSLIFVQLGGDKVSWEKGLIGLATVIKPPFDKGYDKKGPRNFKLGLKMRLVLKKVIKREEFKYFADAYDAGGIGPSTRGEQNQAIKWLSDAQGYAVLRAMAESQPDLETQIRSIFDAGFCSRIFGKMTCMEEVDCTYEEAMSRIKSREEDAEFEESNKNLFEKWLRAQVKPEGTAGAGEKYGEASINTYLSELSGIKVSMHGRTRSIFAVRDAVLASSLEEGSTKDPSNQKGHNKKSSAVKLYVGFLSETYNQDTEEVKTRAPKIKFRTGITRNEERNRIIFGAPGTGKSFKLNEDLKTLLNMKNEEDEPEGAYSRVTFYPDYAYSQFIGAYKPVTDSDGKSICYEFVPGPFMNVLVEALKYSRKAEPKPCLLVIEEINRAKAAAVFGDMFQLLDRDDFGVSLYDIQAPDAVKKYLARPDVLGGLEDEYSRIRIPDNMFIWATMNSADQGVFPMDTAFKRRWNFEYIGIDENEDRIKGWIEAVEGDPSSMISWNRLRKAINEKLVKEYKVNEDKLLGPFFLTGGAVETYGDRKRKMDSAYTDSSAEDALIACPEKFRKAFKSKVLMYLYEDAARQYRQKLFSGCSSLRYSAVCSAFDELGIGIFGGDFKEDYYDLQEG